MADPINTIPKLHRTVTRKNIGIYLKNSEKIVELSVLVKNGFVEPIMVNERIRSYRLSNFTKDHEIELNKELRH